MFVSSQVVFVPSQDFLGEVHSYQSNLSLKACTNICRSRVPKFPFSLGKQHLGQLTLHFHLESWASPAKTTASCPFLVEKYLEVLRCGVVS